MPLSSDPLAGMGCQLGFPMLARGAVSKWYLCMLLTDAGSRLQPPGDNGAAQRHLHAAGRLGLLWHADVDQHHAVVAVLLAMSKYYSTSGSYL
jgi:hypothetical protein